MPTLTQELTDPGRTNYPATPLNGLTENGTYSPEVAPPSYPYPQARPMWGCFDIGGDAALDSGTWPEYMSPRGDELVTRGEDSLRYTRPGSRTARTSTADTESSRRVVFMDNISDAIREDRDLGFTKQSYITRLTQGELLRAAQAYEHVRPELWPFGTARRFNAAEISAWRRLARAAAFLELECKRLNAPGTEEHKDAVHEIRRLTSKAIDCRWSSQQEEESTLADPF